MILHTVHNCLSFLFDTREYLYRFSINGMTLTDLTVSTEIILKGKTVFFIILLYFYLIVCLIRSFTYLFKDAFLY